MVRLGEDRRNDALPERVVERVVYRGRGNSETRRGGTIDLDIGCQPHLLQIAGDIGEFRCRPQPRQQLRDPDGELGGVGIFEDETILGGAYRRIDGQVLYRLHIKRDAGDRCDFLLQAANDGRNRKIALIARSQIDQKATGVPGRIGAIDTDERG